MTRLRRALGRIAVTWLFCQATTFTLAPAVLWFSSGEALLECTCTHGDHAICPMHHKPSPDSKLCLMGSADDQGAAALSSLFGAGDLVLTQTPAAPLDSQRVAALVDQTTRSLRPDPPDPPPPRV